MKNSYLVYGLIDPRDRAIRYIGKSVSGFKRPSEHRMPSVLSKNKGYSGNWIRKLHSLGLDYEIVVLMDSTRESLSSDENWWIAYGRMSGWRLTNLTDGGDGSPGRVDSPEVREKRAAKLRGRKRTPEQLARIREVARTRNYVTSEETKQKLRDKQALYMSNPANRLNVSKKMTDRVVGEETREILRKLAIPARPEVRVKISQALKGRKKSPEHAEAIRAAVKLRTERYWKRKLNK